MPLGFGSANLIGRGRKSDRVGDMYVCPTSRERERDTEQLLDMVRRMFRAIARRVGEEDPEQLASLAGLRRDLELAIADAVLAQRSAGVTWEALGEQLGVTRQAVQMRYGPKTATGSPTDGR